MMIKQLLDDDAAKQTLRRVWLASLLFLLVQLGLSAQTTAQVQAQDYDSTAMWTVEDCMRYAVAHNHGLRQRELQLDNSEATRMQAIGAFLPGVSASTGTQWNFGRAIDPETNTYTSVSTFNNGYGLSASLPVFDGLYRVHALRAARADVLLQKNALQAERDQVALETYQAYVDVVYAQEAVGLAAAKVDDSRQLLRQTQVMEEEGLKSAADVAQMEAQLAADELLLTRQEGQRETSMLALRKVMTRPTSLPLPVREGRRPTPLPLPVREGSIYLQGLNINCEQGEEVTTPLPHRVAREKEVDLMSSSPSDRGLTPKPRTDRQGGGALSLIGECGLDRLCATPYDLQLTAFEAQIALSEELCRPIILHCVRALDDVLRLKRGTTQPWIWHGFRGKPQQLQQLLDHGFYVSFGFRHHADSLRACPSDRLFLETDDTPSPIAPLYATAANLRATTDDELRGRLWDNVNALFQ